MSNKPTHIRIVSTPPGFPPDSVRKHWIDVVIPLLNPEEPMAYGIQCNPRTGEIISGEGSFLVKTQEAIDALRIKSNDAYQWFVDNAIVEKHPEISFQSAFCVLVLNGKKYLISLSA